MSTRRRNFRVKWGDAQRRVRSRAMGHSIPDGTTSASRTGRAGPLMGCRPQIAQDGSGRAAELMAETVRLGRRFARTHVSVAGVAERGRPRTVPRMATAPATQRTPLATYQLPVPDGVDPTLVCLIEYNPSMPGHRTKAEAERALGHVLADVILRLEREQGRRPPTATAA